MIERIWITLIILLAASSLYGIYRRRLLSRRVGKALQVPGYDAAGRPAILYFSSPHCAPCQAIQRPALDRLIEMSGGKLQVIEVNALEEGRLADEWGVLSLPTTFLIDSQGRPRGVNHGVAREAKLAQQLRKIDAWPLAEQGNQDAGAKEGVDWADLIGPDRRGGRVDSLPETDGNHL
jgi:thiol-disulfide isomerase/thioredoxin